MTGSEAAHRKPWSRSPETGRRQLKWELKRRSPHSGHKAKTDSSRCGRTGTCSRGYRPAYGLYREIGFLDDDPGVADTGLPFPLLGSFSEYGKWLGEADFAVAIGNNAVREALQDRLTAAGASLATLIHPRAFVASRVTLGAGSVVMAGAVINVDAVIGRGVIVQHLRIGGS